MSNLELGMWLVVVMGIVFILIDKFTSKNIGHSH